MELTMDIAGTWTVGTGLARPECVLCMADGSLFTSHLGHGIMHIRPDGTQCVVGNTAHVDGRAWVPNGFALMEDGGFLVANMGEGGGLWHLGAGGELRPELREVDGMALSAANFVLDDGARTWVSVSTRQWPISRAFTAACADGYIVVRDGRGSRIVADGLAFANEVRIDPAGGHLYAAETFARRISRFRIHADASLGPRETFTTFGHGCFPDGLAFDEAGYLWVASIVSNRLIRVAPDGSQAVLLEDYPPERLEKIESLLRQGLLDREAVAGQTGDRLRNISSIAFGGADLRTGYLGSLGGDTLVAFRSPIAGHRPSHWSRRAPNTIRGKR